jgi:hypothetical protein
MILDLLPATHQCRSAELACDRYGRYAGTLHSDISGARNDWVSLAVDITVNTTQ